MWAPACGTIFAEHDIVRNAKLEQVRAWREHRSRRVIELLPGFRWCSNAHCGSGQQLEDCDNNPIMICHECGAKVIA